MRPLAPYFREFAKLGTYSPKKSNVVRKTVQEVNPNAGRRVTVLNENRSKTNAIAPTGRSIKTGVVVEMTDKRPH